MTSAPVGAAPVESIRTAAARMAGHEVSALVVEAERPGILTARDLLELVAEGQVGEGERVSDHFTPDATSTTADTSLDDAVAAMVKGGFRHLVVKAERVTGVLAMGDVVRCWVDADATPRQSISIRRAMATDFLKASGDEPVRRAVEAMSRSRAAAAIVGVTRDRSYPGIFTEAELVATLAAGADLGTATVADNLAPRMTFSAPGWSVKQAAEAMRSGGFQHVVVVDQYEVRGVIAIRDIVRAWTEAEQ